MKKCNGCQVVKEDDEYTNKLLPSGKACLVFKCKSCINDTSRTKWSQKTSEEKKEKQRRQAEKRDRNRLFVWNYLTANSCEHCGESDPVVLEFDHIGEKTANISYLVKQAMSIKTIEAEIAQCRVLCANCHRRRTAKQLGWFGGINVDRTLRDTDRLVRSR